MPSVIRLRRRVVPTSSDFFSADFSQTSVENVAPGKWTMIGTNSATYHPTWWTRTHRLGVGPSGEDAWEINLVNTGVDGTQPYVGWGPNGGNGLDGLGHESPAYGTNWYVRLLIRVTSDTNWRAPNGKNYNTKFLMFGDGGGGWTENPGFDYPHADHRTRSRAIMYIRGDRTAPSNFQIQLKFDAAWGPETSFTDVPIGTWLWIQLGLEGCSPITGPAFSQATANGRLAFWINNTNYASPTQALGSMRVATKGWDPDDLGWSQVHVGAFSNESLDTDGVFKVQLAKFKVGTAFDSSWGA